MAIHQLGTDAAGKPAEGDVSPEEDFIDGSFDEIAHLEARSRVAMSAHDHAVDGITAFSGSLLYVLVHMLWFGAWIALNAAPGAPRFDPFPFPLLSIVVSLEAIFLSTFVLISQNRQADAADRRGKVDLQVNVIAEREVTKVMELVIDIHNHLGIARAHDAELEQMQSRAHVADLADAVEHAETNISPGDVDVANGASRVGGTTR